MKKVTVLLLAMGALSLISGCKEDQSTVVQTVDWYKSHSSERAEVLSNCNNNPGELALTPNCVNASRAASATTWGAKGAGIAPLKPLTAQEINKK